MTETATALTIQRSEQSGQFMPVMSIDLAIERRNVLVAFTQKLMVAKVDYGVIPGTGNKPTLLKPGAEKLCSVFGLVPRFTIVDKVEDWTGEAHKGEPFFYYLYRCSLYRNGTLMAETDASCNSWETKYRYRSAERVCPKCNKAAIIKGKADFGGGWLCFTKKDGCGAKFRAGDPAIEGQNTGKVPNADIAELVNTLQKMSQKRALIGSTLIAVNASEFYTQDIEDMTTIEGQFVPAAEPEQEPLPTVEEARATLKSIADAYGYSGSLRDLCPVLVSDTPLKLWTAETFVTAARRPAELWRFAIDYLKPKETPAASAEPITPRPIRYESDTSAVVAGAADASSLYVAPMVEAEYTAAEHAGKAGDDEAQDGGLKMTSHSDAEMPDRATYPNKSNIAAFTI
jgi:hypothetical protein